MHFHPGRRFAREHLGLRFGKTESWLILEAEPGAAVHVGLARAGRRPRRSAAGSTRQDADEMLAALQRVPVAAGDAMLVPAGTLHAIGARHPAARAAGADRPVRAGRVEARSASTDGSEHLELGWETALQAMDREPADIAALTAPRHDGLLPDAADPYFRAERVRGGDELGPSFAVLLVTGGEGVLRSSDGDELALTPRHDRAGAVRRRARPR